MQFRFDFESVRVSLSCIMSSGSNAAWLAFTFDVLRAAAVCFCFCGGDSVRAFVFQHILALASIVLILFQLQFQIFFIIFF
jgi:hypothetical protein